MLAGEWKIQEEEGDCFNLIYCLEKRTGSVWTYSRKGRRYTISGGGYRCGNRLVFDEERRKENIHSSKKTGRQ